MTVHIMGIKETSLLSFHVIWIEMLILIICFYKGVYLDLFCLLSLPPSECYFLFIAVHVLWVVIYLYVLNLIYFCGTLQLFSLILKWGSVYKMSTPCCQLPFQSLITSIYWKSNNIHLCLGITWNLVPQYFILRSKMIFILYCRPHIF